MQMDISNINYNNIIMVGSMSTLLAALALALLLMYDAIVAEGKGYIKPHLSCV